MTLDIFCAAELLDQPQEDTDVGGAKNDIGLIVSWLQSLYEITGWVRKWNERRECSLGWLC